MKKRLLSLALALALCLGLAVIPAAASDAPADVNRIVSRGSATWALIDANDTLWMGGADYALGLGQKFEYWQRCIKVMDDVAAVSCGTGFVFTAAIKTDGSLWTWGTNEHGQLGTGRYNDYDHPQLVPVKILDDVAAVSCGGCHAAAIKTDGSLWMWGKVDYGQLTDSVEPNAEDEYGNPIQTVPVKVMDDVVAVSCGNDHTAAIKTDGSLWTWGNNEAGELGSGSHSSCEYVPSKVMDDVAAVRCGVGITAAIKTDGSLWMWGNNNFAQMGTGYTGNSRDLEFESLLQTVPVKVMDDVREVIIDGGTVAAVKIDGSLWVWSVLAKLEQEGWVDGLETLTVTFRGNTNEFRVSFVPVKIMDSGVATFGRDSLDNLFIMMEDGSLVQSPDLERFATMPAGFAFKRPTIAVQQPQEPGKPAVTFTDVTETDYYADAVVWAVEQGITQGTGDGKFSPDRTCSNMEILTFLWRAAGEEDVSSDVKAPFDLAPDQWYTNAILWAVEKGMIDESFKLDDPCTRASTVKFIWQAKDCPDPTAPSEFGDVPADADYADAVSWAVENKVTFGGDDGFAPDVICSRGQIATFLHRAMG